MAEINKIEVTTLDPVTPNKLTIDPDTLTMKAVINNTVQTIGGGGSSAADALEKEVEYGKDKIVSAINSRAGSASTDESLVELATDIKQIPQNIIDTVNVYPDNDKIFGTLLLEYQEYIDKAKALKDKWEGYNGMMCMFMSPYQISTSTFATGVSDADAYYFSDGTFTEADTSVTNNAVTHYWDRSKITEGYFVVFLYKEENYACTIRNQNVSNTFASIFVIFGKPISLTTIQSYTQAIIMLDHNDSCDVTFNIYNSYIPARFVWLTHVSGKCVIGGTNQGNGDWFLCCPNLENITNATYSTVVNASYQTRKVYMPKLKTLFGYFGYTKNGSVVDFPSLETVTGYLVYYSEYVTKINVPNLKYIEGGSIVNQQSFPFLTEINCPALEQIGSSSYGVSYSFPLYSNGNLAPYLTKMNLPNLKYVYNSYNPGHSIINSYAVKQVGDEEGVAKFPSLIGQYTSYAWFPVNKYNPNIKRYELPEMTYSRGFCMCNSTSANQNSTLESVYAPKLTVAGEYASNGCLAGFTALKKVQLGNLIAKNNNNAFWNADSFTNCPNLIHLEFNTSDGTAAQTYHIPISKWNPTNALSTEDTSLIEDEDKGFTCNLDQFLYNFQTYIIDRLKDNTGGTKFTLYLSSAVYNILTDDMKTSITSKNWNVTGS